MLLNTSQGLFVVLQVLTEEKKNRDQLIRDSENITKKTKIILAGLKTAEADLEAFQVIQQNGNCVVMKHTHADEQARMKISEP